MTLQVKPAFRHIKSDSYLDRLCGSGTNVKSSLERSESFAAVSSTGKGFGSPRGNDQKHVRGAIFSPQDQRTASLRKSEPVASKSDILSGSSISKHMEDSVPDASFSLDQLSSQIEQDLNTCGETFKMVDLYGLGKDKPAVLGPGSSELASSSFTRVCRSESFCDQMENSAPPCIAGDTGNADIAQTETESFGGDTNSAAAISSGVGMAPPRLPLSLKTSLEGLDGDLGQGPLHRSYTSDSSLRDSHENVLERSLGRINNILDGSFEYVYSIIIIV